MEKAINNNLGFGFEGIKRITDFTSSMLAINLQLFNGILSSAKKIFNSTTVDPVKYAIIADTYKQDSNNINSITEFGKNILFYGSILFKNRSINNSIYFYDNTKYYKLELEKLFDVKTNTHKYKLIVSEISNYDNLGEPVIGKKYESWSGCPETEVLECYEIGYIDLYITNNGIGEFSNYTRPSRRKSGISKALFISLPKIVEAACLDLGLNGKPIKVEMEDLSVGGVSGKLATKYLGFRRVFDGDGGKKFVRDYLF